MGSYAVPRLAARLVLLPARYVFNPSLTNACCCPGFTLAATIWWALSILWPPPGLGEVDDHDVFGTFTELPAGRAEDVAEEELSGKDSQHGGEEEAVESRKWAEAREGLP